MLCVYVVGRITGIHFDGKWRLDLLTSKDWALEDQEIVPLESASTLARAGVNEETSS